MADVFISYSRKDKKFVESLYAALNANKRDIWVDWEAIPLTTDWWLEIQAGIEQADTFIFIITPDSIASSVCNQEIDHAVRHNKRIMPIVHREVDMRQVRNALAKHNALFFREEDDFDTAFALLLKALDTDLKHVRMHTRLLVRSLEWEREGRDLSFLLRDRDLEASERWLEQATDKDPRPTERQIQYIIASQQLRQQQQAYDASYQRAEQELKRALVYGRPTLRKVVWSSLAIAASLCLVRFLGLLQPLELAAYDQLTRLRPSEGIDKRFLIVAITDTDIQAELKEKGTSLSDASLDQLLEKLQTYQPRLIGLDLYRDFAASRASLATKLRQNDQLYGLCKVAETDEHGRVSTAVDNARPTGIARARVGFSDVLDDNGGIIRRHLLLQEKVGGSRCDAEYAFSLLLAKRYLELEPGTNQQYKTPLPAPSTLSDDLKLGGTTFKRLQDFTGGYQGVDAGGYQILLNYRAYTDHQKGPFDRVSLGQILSGKIDPSVIKDKIVLVGVTSHESVNDYKATPYGTGSQELPGVVLQAHMISQLVSAALDQRPLLWVWPLWAETLWILSWSWVGGLIAWRFQRLPLLGGAVVVAIGGLTVFCFVLLTQAGWVPLVPAVLGLVGTSGLLVYIAFRRPQPISTIAPAQKPAPTSANRLL
ncbi:MAG: CHASE2 domain-containing protein [Lyngbya sp. HA4199-MV5]|jgi:CHASE2 domain-containing sensor protein|nr:CHASE2 domain-containing protein [Lyngbya sp. HA4199-MV5]